jgi:hypothetical protein
MAGWSLVRAPSCRGVIDGGDAVDDRVAAASEGELGEAHHVFPGEDGVDWGRGKGTLSACFDHGKNIRFMICRN